VLSEHFFIVIYSRDFTKCVRCSLLLFPLGGEVTDHAISIVWNMPQELMCFSANSRRIRAANTRLPYPCMAEHIIYSLFKH